MEREIQKQLLLNAPTNGGDLEVLWLVERYIATRNGVRPTTMAGYRTVVNILKKEAFAHNRIDKVKISDAKLWLIKLQRTDGRSYSTIHTIRGVLRPAFQMAVDDDLIPKNPFSFALADVIINDSAKRKAISREDERRFLQFVKEDKHFSRYYEGIYILFKTGMRISEFCGLTVNDIDFDHHLVRIDHQLQKHGSLGYYIEKTKTSSGTRMLPMTEDVEECFQKIVANRQPPEEEPSVEGYSGFLYFDKGGSIAYALHWEHYFQHIVEKFNGIYKQELPRITPHICRHTYCTNMARAGMNPKTLQYLMGHSEIGVTLNVYTHVSFDDAQQELARMGKSM